MSNLFRKAFFKIKRLGDDPSEEEKLAAMMIPSHEVTERDLLAKVNQAKSANPLFHAAFSVQAELRLMDRSTSGISDARQDHLERLRSIAWDFSENTKELYQALTYLGFNLDKKKRTPLNRKYYEYYTKVIYKGKVRYRKLRQVGSQLWSTIGGEIEIRKLIGEGFEVAGTRECPLCSTECYYMYSPDWIDHSNYEEINDVADEEPLCTGHQLAVRDERVALCTVEEGPTTFLDSE